MCESHYISVNVLLIGIHKLQVFIFKIIILLPVLSVAILKKTFTGTFANA